MATDDLLNGNITVTEFDDIGNRCRKRMKAIAAAAIVVVATIMMMTPTMAEASGGLGLRLRAEITQRLEELDARFGSCSGILTTITPDELGAPIFYALAGGDAICGISSDDSAKVLSACHVGQPCKVTGKMNDCDGADYCVEFLSITSAKKD